MKIAYKNSVFRVPYDFVVRLSVKKSVCQVTQELPKKQKPLCDNNQETPHQSNDSVCVTVLNFKDF